MADTTDIEKTAPPLFNIKSPLDYSKFNPVAGTYPNVEKQQSDILAANDLLAKSLEERYAQPNWFKVAAGFLKPQLGGFGASLGTASQALGENVEAQRAIAPSIARMRAETAQGRLGLETNKSQYQALQDYNSAAKDDTVELQRILAMNPASDVGAAIIKKMELDAAKRAQTTFTVDTAIKATGAMAKDPMLDLGEFTNIQFKPGADLDKVKAKQDQVLANIAASKPPQVSDAQWNGMGRYDQMAMASEYAKAQLEKGMSTEDKLRQQANTAPERLGLLRSIRDLSLGAGIPESKDAAGKTINGQQQMGALLNKFGGNNPMEVFARAMADGKGPALLQDIDVYARQAGMSEEAKNKFQVLVKLLAENQVTLRNSALNPTDAFGQLQTLATPNIGNSQNALVTLVDLISHSEKHSQELYNYAKNAKKAYGELERDIGYNELRSNYAKEHARIAASNPLMTAPESYSPSSGNVSARPAATPAAQSRPNERKINGQVWVRQPDGSYTPKAQ